MVINSKYIYKIVFILMIFCTFLKSNKIYQRKLKSWDCFRMYVYLSVCFQNAQIVKERKIQDFLKLNMAMR